MKIIPALDILNGKCVRLFQGQYSKVTSYFDDPISAAQHLEQQGALYLHVVDLNGAKSEQSENLGIIKKIISSTSLKIDFGGGIKSIKAAEKIFDLGVNQINIGTLAVTKQDSFKEILSTYGAEKIILSVDFKDRNIRTMGWLDNSQIDIFDFITQNIQIGVKNFMMTDISRDGTMSNSNFDMYKKVLNNFPEIKLIASGGISSTEDLDSLKKINCSGAVIGKAIYENKLNLSILLNNYAS
jgi:phosphoribosylformimino-5-aminoimidazole carboxamide ribotide isomerase